MSKLRVNKISNNEGDGPVTFSKGLTFPDFQTIDVESVGVVGVCTATAFSGDGANLTNLAGISLARAVAYAIIT